MAFLIFGCAQPQASSPNTAGTSASSPPPSPEKTVSIKGFAFNPAATTVNMGMTVTWTNEDSVPHALKFDDGTASPVLSTGQSYSRTFDKAGDYPYICSIHTSMKGSVKVIGAVN